MPVDRAVIRPPCLNNLVACVLGGYPHDCGLFPRAVVVQGTIVCGDGGGCVMSGFPRIGVQSVWWPTFSLFDPCSGWCIHDRGCHKESNICQICLFYLSVLVAMFEDSSWVCGQCGHCGAGADEWQVQMLFWCRVLWLSLWALLLCPNLVLFFTHISWVSVMDRDWIAAFGGLFGFGGNHSRCR